MVNAFAKLTENESLIPQAGTKVISSLFSKLSKYNPITAMTIETTDVTAKENEQQQLDDIEVPEPIIIENRKAAISINVFYEDVYPKANLGHLHAKLENYAASVPNGPLDTATLSLLSRHYRNLFEYDEEDGIEWSVLKDILGVILQQDTALGNYITNSQWAKCPLFDS